MKDLKIVLTMIQKQAGNTIDLSEVLRYCEEFRKQIAQFTNEYFPRLRFRSEISEVDTLGLASSTINAYLMKLCRAINPVLFTTSGKFKQDPAISFPFLPGLQPATSLPRFPSDSDEQRFLKTGLIRERNRVVHALHHAINLLVELNTQLKTLLK